MSISTFTNTHKKYFARATIAGIFGLAGFFILISVAFAAPNPQINYQGKITNSSNVALADGSYQVVFSLYTVPTGGTAVWTETRNGANEVALTNGLFSVMLGSVTSLSGIDFNQTLYLGVTFEADSEMLPRKILGTVPAAFEANNANTVGGVASTSLIRNDQAGTITGSTTASLFSIIQNGTGSILNLFSNSTNVLSVLNNGNVGIGSTTPGSKLTVGGNTFVGGNLTATGTLSISGISTLATTTISSSTITTLNLINALALTSGGTGANTAAGARTNLGATTIGDNIFTLTNPSALSFLRINADNTVSAVATSTLGIALSDTTGILAAIRGGTGLSTITQNQLLIGGAGNTWLQVATSSLGLSSSFTNSSQLAALLSDETGSAGGGLAVFSNGPTFTSTTNFADFIGTNATITSATTTNLAIASLTSGRVPYLTTGGRLIDSANLTYDGTSLTLGTDVALSRGAANRLDLATGDSLNLVSGTIMFGGTSYLTASSGNDSITFGESAGAMFTANTVYNIAIGFEAGKFSSSTLSDFSNFIGYQAGQNSRGAYNNIFGANAGQDNTGAYNNIFGRSAGSSNTGLGNIMIARSAGSSNTGNYNIILGEFSGFGNTGDENNIFGSSSGYSNTGAYNNMFGSSAGRNNTGSYSEFMGFEAGRLMSASSSIAIGALSLRGGSGAGGNNATTTNNIAIGYGAGYNVLTGGNNNILLGYQAADSLTTGANNIIIGYDVEAPSNTASNQLNIGNLIFGNNINGTGTTTSAGNIGIGSTSPSSKLTVAGNTFIGGNLTATGTLAISGISTLSTTTITNLTLAQALSATSGGTGLSTITQNQLLIGGAGNTWSQVATSSLGLSASFTNSTQLAALLSDETGSAGGGLAVFSNGPTFTGTTNFANLIGTNATITSATTTNLAISSLTSGRVPYLTTGGRLIDSGNFVYDGTNLVVNRDTSGISTTLNLRNSLNGLEQGPRLEFSGSATPLSYIEATRGITAGSSDLRFSVGGSAMTEVMRIDYNRNVGIGTTSPASKLDIWGGLRVGTSSVPNLFVDTTNSFVGIGTTTKYGTEAIGLGGDLALNGRVIAPAGGNTTSLGFSTSGNLQYSVLNGSTASMSLTNSSAVVGSGMELSFRSNSVQSAGIESRMQSSGNHDLFFSTRGSNVLNERMRIFSNGNVSIGTTSSSSLLTVGGTMSVFGTSTLATSTITNLTLAQALGTVSGGTGLSSYTTGDLLFASGANTLAQRAIGTTGQVLQVVGGLPTWVATSSLGITGGGGGATTFLALTDVPSSYTANRILFTNTGATALTNSANFTFDGTLLSVPNLTVSGTSTFTGTSTFANSIVSGTQMVAGLSTLASTSINGFLQLGTSSVASRFNLDVGNFNTAGTAGLNRYYTSTNAASGTVQFGELGYVRLGATATTTMVGSMFRVEDSTTFGNTVRGFEVQTNRGTNTRGENTALSGFARTFGVRGFTSADAGSVFEPAGGYFETGGTTQGNAVRGYSSTITSASLLALFQDTSVFSGAGLKMNLGNGSGSFTGNFIDLQVAGATQFKIASTGAMTVGTGTSTDPAGANIVGSYMSDGFFSTNRSANPAINAGRTNDGAVMQFFSGGAIQGSISIAAATVSYNAFTGSHFGLTQGQVYDVGTLMVLSGQNQSYNNDSTSEILYGMTASDEENSSTVIGSYLSVLEPSKTESTSNPTLVMAVGNGAMWVADQGTDIVRGEYLISSDVSGHAERDPKTADVSNIIARASEDINWSDVSAEINGVKHKRITVFFESFTRVNMDLAAIASSTVELSELGVDSSAGKFMAGLLGKLTAWFGDAQNGIGSMYANVFNASERICVDGECLTADDIRALKGGVGGGSTGTGSSGSSSSGGGDVSGGSGGDGGTGAEGTTGSVGDTGSTTVSGGDGSSGGSSGDGSGGGSETPPTEPTVAPPEDTSSDGGGSTNGGTEADGSSGG